MRNILLTRPLADSQWLAQVLKTRGVESVIAPLSEIVPLSYEAMNIPAALLFTSRHALTNIPQFLPDTPVFCIGEATAEAAKALGYTHITHANADVKELVAQVKNSLPAGSEILYLRGREVHHDMVSLLKDYTVTERIGYDVKRLDTLPDMIGITGVALFSKASAEHFLTLAGDVSRLTSYCFSEAIAQTARSAGFARIVISTSQTREAMVDSIAND